jgi:hypothetical protein
VTSRVVFGRLGLGLRVRTKISKYKGELQLVYCTRLWLPVVALR